jgi:hypothetical protein
MTAISYKNNFEITADNFRDVIGNFNFLAFQSPVKVSTNIANPIKNKMPEIGKKNEPTTANNFGKDKRILANNINNCIFIAYQIVAPIGESKINQARRRQASKIKRLQNTLRLPSNKRKQKT